MLILLESFLVGLYVFLLYKFLILFQIKNLYLFLFVLGFLKHFIGYVLSIQSFYCKYGHACKKYNFTTKKKDFIILESFLEGILFLVCGQFFLFFYKKIPFFLLGFLLHLLFEFIGFHDVFCLKRCF